MEEDKKFKYPFTLLIAQYTLTTKNKLIEHLKAKYDNAYLDNNLNNLNNMKIDYNIINIQNFINKEMKKNLFDIIKYHEKTRPTYLHYLHRYHC